MNGHQAGVLRPRFHLFLRPYQAPGDYYDSYHTLQEAQDACNPAWANYDVAEIYGYTARHTLSFVARGYSYGGPWHWEILAGGDNTVTEGQRATKDLC